MEEKHGKQNLGLSNCFMIKMNNKALWICTLFYLLYVVLAGFNLAYASHDFRWNDTVMHIGKWTEFGVMSEIIWTPGHLVGFLLGRPFGNAGFIIGQMITFWFGETIILGMFNRSWRNVMDSFENMIKK